MDIGVKISGTAHAILISIAIFGAPLAGDVKETVEFVGSLIGIIGVVLFIAGLFYTKQPVTA